MGLSLPLSCAMVAILATAQPAHAETTETAPDVTAFAPVIDGLENAWREGDAEAFADLFVEEGYFTTWFGNRVSGRNDLIETRRFLFANVYPGTALKIEPVQWRLIGTDVALVRADSWIYRASEPEPTNDPDVSPLLVLERTSDGWKVAAFQNTPVQDPPLELPEVYGED